MSPAIVAAVAAALAGAALLGWLLSANRRVEVLERGDGAPLLLLPAQKLFLPLHELGASNHLFALKGPRGRLLRAARALIAERALGAPTIIAHRRACAVALALGAEGLAAGLVLIAPPRLRAPEADALFPPTVIVGGEHPALAAALPTVERIAAPGLGNNPQKKRPDLIAAALARVEAMAATAPD